MDRPDNSLNSPFSLHPMRSSSPMRSPFFKRHFNIEPTNLNQSDIRASGQLRIAHQTNLSCTKTARSHCTRCAHRVPCEARFSNVISTLNPQISINLIYGHRVNCESPSNKPILHQNSPFSLHPMRSSSPMRSPFFKRQFNMNLLISIKLIYGHRVNCESPIKQTYLAPKQPVLIAPDALIESHAKPRFSNVISTLNPQISIKLIYGHRVNCESPIKQTYLAPKQPVLITPDALIESHAKPVFQTSFQH
jgi:hypothetical protein